MVFLGRGFKKVAYLYLAAGSNPDDCASEWGEKMEKREKENEMEKGGKATKGQREKRKPA